MGGVGKTCLVTHVKDEIKREGGTLNFKHVFWVTVSQKFSIFKLQNDIAKRVGLKLDEDDEIIRAEMLSSALEERKKCVLILDDVWNYIDLYKVGIPLRVNGVKLILTSRLKHVYQQMGCPPNNIISMEPLFDDEEAWELFSLKLGYNGTPATLPPDVEEIAKAVAKKCEGLPLGISVIARNMKEVNDIGQWRHALNKFQNLATGEEMEKELFKVLKFSYDNLIDINMQKCFLNCALYGQIEYTREFIIKMVDKGLINGMRSLEEIFDEGLAILVKLESHSLLLHKGDGNLCMHDLVRNMACHIMGHGYMVKCNRGLTRIPRIHEWTADLELVSLANNKIEEIPVGTSPQCPKLSTLIFSHNLYSCIPDCFFHHMNALTELDISDNASLTCLPNSLSNLRSLVCLVLRGCESLKYVPSLGELQKLSRLDISHTSIEKVPRGLEMLINLKWLNLSGNKRLTLETWSVVQSLTSMQYLDLLSENVKVEVEDVQGMSMLECFRCNFRDCKNLNDYVKTTLAPNTYDLRLGNSCSFDFESELEDRTVSFGDCEEFEHLLPRDVTKLRIGGNQQWTGCLCDALSFNGPSSLREIRIEDCTKLESLFCLSVSCSFCTHLQHLEYLRLQCLGSLDVIWKENDDGVTAMSPPPGGIDMFSHLKHLEIWRCDKMEKLMTSAWLPQLPNLESIKVHSCESMKEIFACEVDTITVTLPNLTNLTLKYLRQLKTVCSGIIATKSSPRVYAICCPDLKCSLKYKSSDSISDSVTPLEFRVSPL
ncbi:probable disease resistance protein At4g27220 [Gastrolobium bilobum]|uniref:probable disease resistance protein At4g27220 n=1 Tax=Gastrolobium bilobum TaxID=150636 RepID=UPI002AB18C48|nr:probable disease resistance protein At4g27220 [Gastrolobium bilobum]